MCNNEKKDTIAAIITELTVRNKKSEIMNELKLSRFNNEMVRLNNEQIARLTTFNNTLNYTDCGCDYCEALEKAKQVELDMAQSAKNIITLEEKYSILLDHSKQTSESITSIASIVNSLVEQIALIEDKYNIIDTIKEDN